MTRKEAFQEMMSGKKISHQYFGSNEYYEIKNDKIIAEDGVNHTRVFWSNEQNNFRANGWELYN
jgi:hypothetical protein